MKIWILSSEIPTYNPGGIARYVDNFSRYLAREGHEVTVISRADKAETIEVIPGYRLHTFYARYDAKGEVSGPSQADQANFPYNTLDYWTAHAFQLAEVVGALALAEGNPDVIESQEYGGIAYYVQQRQLTEPGYLSGVPVVIHAHSPDFILRRINEEPAYQFPAYWTGQLEKACIRAADTVIAPSQYLARQLEGLMDGVKVESIPLPWTDLGDLKGKVAVKHHEVMYLGRLEVRKGVLKMLREVELMWQEGAVFKLTLVGGDCAYLPRNTTVRTFIEKRYAHWIEIGRLVIEGHLEHGDLMRRIREQAVILIPSIWENWPNTCIEAMSLEKVVVGSTDGGQAEMIGPDEKAGFLFDWAREGDFRRQFEKALALNDSQLTQIGKEAHTRIASWCEPGKVVAKRLAHFEALIKKGKTHTKRFPFVNKHLRESTAATRFLSIDSVPGLVSAIIPYYNMGRFIDETVDSIMTSDYENIELVIVDDGSTDPASVEKLRDLEQRGIEELKIVRGPNQGLATARCLGVEAARGQYIVLVDADDQIEPSFIRRGVQLMEQYENVQIVFSWEQYFGDCHDVFPGWNFEFPYLLGHNQTCPICVVDRAAWLTHGRNKRKFSYNFEDYESWVSMVAAGCGGVCIHECLVKYRIRNDGLWQGSGRPQQLFLYELLASEHPHLFQEYGLELFCLQNANGSAQEWLKPAMESPYDRRLKWETQEIGRLKQFNQRLKARIEELERVGKEA